MHVQSKMLPESFGASTSVITPVRVVTPPPPARRGWHVSMTSALWSSWLITLSRSSMLTLIVFTSQECQMELRKVTDYFHQLFIHAFSFPISSRHIQNFVLLPLELPLVCLSLALDPSPITRHLLLTFTGPRTMWSPTLWTTSGVTGGGRRGRPAQLCHMTACSTWKSSHISNISVKVLKIKICFFIMSWSAQQSILRYFQSLRTTFDIHV